METFNYRHIREIDQPAPGFGETIRPVPTCYHCSLPLNEPGFCDEECENKYYDDLLS